MSSSDVPPRSQRPTLPAKSVSPVSNVVAPSDRSANDVLPGVCPGVCSTSSVAGPGAKRVALDQFAVRLDQARRRDAEPLRLFAQRRVERQIGTVQQARRAGALAHLGERADVVDVRVRVKRDASRGRPAPPAARRRARLRRRASTTIASPRRGDPRRSCRRMPAARPKSARRRRRRHGDVHPEVAIAAVEIAERRAVARAARDDAPDEDRVRPGRILFGEFAVEIARASRRGPAIPSGRRGCAPRRTGRRRCGPRRRGRALPDRAAAG